MARPHIRLPELSPQRIARFKRKVLQLAASECWTWQGTKDPDGYGSVSLIINGKECHIRAHRIAYYLAHGIDPLDLIVCHSCDNPPCVNPDHLWLGTSKDNTQDAVRKGRNMRGDSHYFRTRPECVPKGETHYRAKLRAEQVLEIRATATHFSRNEIAKRYGVSKRMIQFIVQRKSWKHI